MPIPAAIAGAAIAGGSSLIGAGINAFSTSQQNRKSREFSLEMYNRQIADQERFWNMQNEYNSPQAQMERFRAAGLNPALIYGQSNEGASLSLPSVMAPEFRPAQYGDIVSDAARSYFDTFYDIKMKNAQYDNIVEQNEVIKQEALLKRASIAGVLTGTAKKQFELQLAQELRQTSVDFRKAELEKARVDIVATRNRDVREAVAGAANLQEVLSRLESAALARNGERINQAKNRAEINRIREDTVRIRENIRILRSEAITKQFEAELTKKGVRPNSPEWSRLFLEAGSELWDMIFGD
nr:MAG: DNA pilot protein [Microvirus sp.]